jgi:hypothetical protein
LASGFCLFFISLQLVKTQNFGRSSILTWGLWANFMVHLELCAIATPHFVDTFSFCYISCTGLGSYVLLSTGQDRYGR